MNKRYLYFLAALAVASLPSVAQAQKVGPQFQVNQSTTGYESDADVASDSAGNFMVVWHNTGYYGHGVFGRNYDSDGNPLTDQFQIGEAGYPAIASTNGNFIVVWNSSGDGDERILGRRYDSDGNPLGGSFQVNRRPANGPGRPHVASDANGNFVVVWSQLGYAGLGRRFDSNGTPLGDQFFVRGNGSVASDANGNFVVIWGGYYAELFGQRYDNTGTSVGDSFQVNTYTTNKQDSASVAATPDGHFLVVWESGGFSEPGPDGNDYGVSGQLYDATGTRVGEELQINQYTTCNQGHPDVAVDVAGNFVVVWQNGFYHERGCGLNKDNVFGRRYDVQGNPGDVVFGRRYDVQGRPLTDEFQVDTKTSSSPSRFPSVASASSGSFVVVWESYRDPQVDGYGVFGQRFSTDCQASVAVEGDVQPPGGTLRVQVHIAHHRPKTITVPWELRLLDANGQRIVKRTTEPHTFEPGDVVDRSVAFRLPDDLAAGTYTLELAISGMAGTKGATTTFRVVAAE